MKIYYTLLHVLVVGCQTQMPFYEMNLKTSKSVGILKPVTKFKSQGLHLYYNLSCMSVLPFVRPWVTDK